MKITGAALKNIILAPHKRKRQKMELLTAGKVSLEFFGGRKSYYSVNSMARKKQIPSLKIGKSLFFDREVLEEFFKANMSKASGSDSEEPREINMVNGIKRIE